MAQRTAMQGLWEWIDANCHEDGFNINDARDMSLKLEKEQMINAVLELSEGHLPPKLVKENAEKYYNETYNK